MALPAVCITRCVAILPCHVFVILSGFWFLVSGVHRASARNCFTSDQPNLHGDFRAEETDETDNGLDDPM